MGRDWDKALEFWADSGVIPCLSMEGQEVVKEGFRFRWTRNELGSLYLKSTDPHGQVGGHLAPTYTLQEYIQQARAMAEAHAASLSPEIKAMIGMEIALAGMFDMAPAPRPADMEASTEALFL